MFVAPLILILLCPLIDPIKGQITDDKTCECVLYYRCNATDLLSTVSDSCGDYLTVCCEPKDIIADPREKKSITFKPNECGKRNPKGVGFAIDGLLPPNDAQFGEFPWMVALLSEESIKPSSDEKFPVYKCGGSLIHPQVALTAAHCVSNKTKRYKIRAGEWDVQSKNEIYPHQDRYVNEVVVHPEFNEEDLFYDFALLFLDSPLEITENVDVVCLPDQNQVLDNLTCYLSGWGKNTLGIYNVILQKHDLPIINKEICERKLQEKKDPAFKINESFICAGKEPGVCSKGYAGSPLVCPIHGKENKYFQAGIFAWGIGCGEDSVPGVYAHVTKSLQWIDKIMVSHNFDTTSYKA